MFRPFPQIIFFLAALTGLLFGDFAVAAPASPARPACDYTRLKLGPAFELNVNEHVVIDRARDRLGISWNDAALIFDLDRGGAATLAEPRQFMRDAEPRYRSNALDVGALDSGQRIAIGNGADAPMRLHLANGRNVTIARLYADTYVLKVGAQDHAAYRSFGQALLTGKLCGRPIAHLPRALKRKLKPLVLYFLFDALSSGQVDDYAGWVKFGPVFNAFLSQNEKEDFLYIYGYRAAELLSKRPEAERIDTYKGWVFAWTAAEMLFHDKDSMNFTDVSAYQRLGKVQFALLGSQPIPGGAENKFGFYTKPLGDLDLRSMTGERKLHWDWKQGRQDMAAQIEVRPPRNNDDPPPAFPAHARRGLLVLDETLGRSDVRDLIAAYTSYFKSLGFKFTPRSKLANAPAFVKRAMAKGNLDFVIRDGHSDGDDDDVMVIFRNAFILKGRKLAGGKADTIDIVFSLRQQSKVRHISYAEFARLLGQRSKTMKRPLVLFDGSCWGIEKAWFGLAYAPPSQLMEITASTPVNFFANRRGNAMRAVLDGILRGESFAAVRARLDGLPRYASGREDRFVFPDDPLYPRRAPLARIDRRLWSRRGHAPFRPYKPNGYI